MPGTDSTPDAPVLLLCVQGEMVRVLAATLLLLSQGSLGFLPTTGRVSTAKAFQRTKASGRYLSMAGTFYDVTLSKPMGIVLEENDPKLKGVYVKSLSEVRVRA